MAKMSPYERTGASGASSLGASGTSSSGASGTSSGLQSSLQEAGAQVRETAENAVNAIAEQGSRALAKAEKTAEDGYVATRRFVAEQPVVALATVTAFAFALGALWSLTSRRRRLGDDLVDRVSTYFEPQYRALRRRM